MGPSNDLQLLAFGGLSPPAKPTFLECGENHETTSATEYCDSVELPVLCFDLWGRHRHAESVSAAARSVVRYGTCY